MCVTATGICLPEGETRRPANMFSSLLSDAAQQAVMHTAGIQAFYTRHYADSRTSDPMRTYSVHYPVHTNTTFRYVPRVIPGLGGFIGVVISSMQRCWVQFANLKTAWNTHHHHQVRLLLDLLPELSLVSLLIACVTGFLLECCSQIWCTCIITYHMLGSVLSMLSLQLHNLTWIITNFDSA